MAEEERKESASGVDGVDATMGVEGQAAAAPADEAAGDEVTSGTTKETDENVTLDANAQESVPTAQGKPVLSPLIVPSPTILGQHPADDLHPPDSPTTSLISALRASLQQLTEQSHQLNTKLVTSISRVADLEGTLDDLRDEQEQRAKTVEELERDKAQWEESMKTGLLVERDQIRDEMQRLAAGLVEEERRRGSAELGREKLEGEVDVLTATLFDQANTMVATERLGRVQAETRLKLAEENLSAAEAAVRDMQVHLQTLSAAPPPDAQAPQQSLVRQHRFLTSHIPYAEFLSFVNHIRSARPLKHYSQTYYPPTPVSALLSQPFLARAVTEDHEPCLRLDIAPDLSWLSRRSVGAAIIAGELMIEPTSSSTVISATNTPAHEITCSLCAKPVFPNASASLASPLMSSAPPSHPISKTGTSSSRFSLKPFFNSPSVPNSPTPTPSSPKTQQSLGSVYVFRVAPPATSTQSAAEARSYPLCKSGWCLERLRATCAFWHFVRSGLIQVVWKGEDIASTTQTLTSAAVPSETKESASESAQPPALPPRKKSWGLGFKSASPNVASGSASSSGWGLGFKGAGMSPPMSPKIVDQKEGYLAAKDNEEEIGQDEKAIGQENPITSEEPAVDFDTIKSVNSESHAAHEPVANSETTETENVKPETAKEEQKTDGPVSVKQEPDQSASEDTVTPSTTENSAEQEARHDMTAPVSSGSSLHGSEGDEVAFSTPKGTNVELSPTSSSKDVEAEQPAEVESQGASTEVGPTPPANNANEPEYEGAAAAVIELASPKVTQEVMAEESPAVEENPARPSRRQVPSPPSASDAPPPVPRRAAARPRPASRLFDGETPSGSMSPAEGVSTPIVQEDAEPPSADEAPRKEDAPALPPRDGQPPALPARSALPPPLPSRGGHVAEQVSTEAPPLPSRDKQHPASLASTSAKTYADGEDWEAKTWREIVKLKEAMWKARVGVEDVDE